MKHDYGNIVHIGNALYFMALLSKNAEKRNVQRSVCKQLVVIGW